MKKILLILLTLMMLVSCTGRKGNKDDVVDAKAYAEKYIALLKDYQTREKRTDDVQDNADFDKFLDKVFVESMEGDFLTMHYSVVDYKKYGIEKPPVDLGVLKYGFDQDNFDYMEDQLKELQSFDFDKLSYRQQYDYEALEYSLYETLASYAFYQYSYIFSEDSCMPENLISNFTDYTFYDEESVEDYLTCLADVDRYFDDALQYNKDQTDDGHPLLDEWIDYLVEVCLGAVNKEEDNALIVTFNDRLEQLDFLSEEQKAEYIEKNREIVLNEVLPAFSKLKDEIKKYLGKARLKDYVLSNLDPDYAQLQYILSGSNNKDLETVWQEMKDNLSLLEAEYVSVMYDETSYSKFSNAYYGGLDSLNLTGRDCLEYLRLNLNEYYPDLGDVDYDVQVLDPDTAPDTAIAYYWPSPIDNSNQNIIRTNPNNMVEGFETYGTLAHEGFPGHLYQHVFYYRTDPHNFRSAIGFIGYTEGWAVDSQRFAYQFSGVDDYYAGSALFFEDAYYFLLYSIIDLGVNVFGWNEKDIVKYFNSESMLFQFDEQTAIEIMNFLIEMPAVYTAYGIGLSNFMTMEQNTKNAMGDDFDYVSYHEVLLKNGPLPFNILQSAVDEYIMSNGANH